MNSLTIFLSSHPAYWNNAYTQVEIDAAFSKYDELFGHMLTIGTAGKIPVKFVLQGAKPEIKWNEPPAGDMTLLDSFKRDAHSDYVIPILKSITALLEEP